MILLSVEKHFTATMSRGKKLTQQHNRESNYRLNPKYAKLHQHICKMVVDKTSLLLRKDKAMSLTGEIIRKAKIPDIR